MIRHMEKDVRSEERTRAALDAVNERLEELNRKANSGNRDEAHGANQDVRYGLGARAAFMWVLEDLTEGRLQDFGLVPEERQ